MAGEQKSVDDILAELAKSPPAKTDSAKKNPEPPSKNNSIDNILSQIDGRPTKPDTTSISPPLQATLQNVQTRSTSPPAPIPNNIGTDILSELNQVSEGIRKQAEIERQEQERIQRQKRQAKEKEAQEWLSKLDLLSLDGMWFEQFARNYPSQLEAAIVYLFADNE